MGDFMSFFKTVFIAVFAFFSFSGVALACESYRAIDNDELKKMRDDLVNSDVDSIDRLFAFKAMSCSDEQSIRSYAISAARQNLDDPLLMREVIAATLLRKDSLDINIPESKKMNDATKKWFRENGNFLSLRIVSKNKKSGCVSLDAFSKVKPNTCGPARLRAIVVNKGVDLTMNF